MIIDGHEISTEEIRRVIHIQNEKEGTEFLNNDPKLAIDLYHYTTVDAFVSMLKQMKDDGVDYLTFWASNVHYMNDPHELEFFYDELIRIMPVLEDELNISNVRFSALSIPKENPMGIDIDKDIKENVYKRIFRSAYAISFSKHRDYLPMWSLYGNNGGGLCLEFDRFKLNEWFKPEESKGIQLIDISYNVKEVEIWNSLKNYYSTYHDAIDENKQGHDVFSMRRTFIARVLLELSKRMKHSTYAYEGEMRLYDHIVYAGDADEIVAKVEIASVDWTYDKARDPDVRIKNGMLIPYKKIKIPLSSLQSVIVGPTKNNKLQCNALEILLRQMDLNIDVIPSKIPYREL